MEDNLANKIISRMYDHDWFSQWLGIDVIEVKSGYCKLKIFSNSSFVYKYV